MQEKLITKLAGLASTKGVYSLEYEVLGPEKSDENLVVIVPASRMTDLFPAGRPTIGHQFMITLEREKAQQHLIHSLDLANELVPAESLPEYAKLKRYDLKGKENMDFLEQERQRDLALQELKEDKQFQQEAETAQAEAIQETKAAIEQHLARTGVEQYFPEGIDFEEPVTPVQPAQTLSDLAKSTGD